jgi:hypothetical protein
LEFAFALPPGVHGGVRLDDRKNDLCQGTGFEHKRVPATGPRGWLAQRERFANNPRVGRGAPTFRQAQPHVGYPQTEMTIHVVCK